jgi:hypothetical protein
LSQFIVILGNVMRLDITKEVWCVASFGHRFNEVLNSDLLVYTLEGDN